MLALTLAIGGGICSDDKKNGGIKGALPTHVVEIKDSKVLWPRQLGFMFESASEK